MFTNNTLLKCKEILKARKSQNLKYSDLSLPEQVDKKHGFHIECYRKFIASSKLQKEKMKIMETDGTNQNAVCTHDAKNSKPLTMTTRSEIKPPKTTPRTGIFPSVCLFCNQTRKKVKGVEQKLVRVETNDFESNVRKFIDIMEDSTLLARISGIDFAAKEVKYHAYCIVRYQRQAEIRMDLVSKEQSDIVKIKWHLQREIHQQSFEALTSYINIEVINKKEVLSLTEFNNYYRHLL